jgi:hypothetical protein
VFQFRFVDPYYVNEWNACPGFRSTIQNQSPMRSVQSTPNHGSPHPSTLIHCTVHTNVHLIAIFPMCPDPFVPAKQALSVTSRG